MFDISTKENLHEYLIDRNLCTDKSDCSIHYCKGGVSCTVAYVVIDEKPMIIKQGLEQLKTKEEWLCDPNRMNIEYESNRIYFEKMPKHAPETYFYDDVNYIYGREAVPDGCLMWKDYLMNGVLSYPVAKQAAQTLVTIHNACHNDEKVKEMFKDKAVFHSLRISPYIDFTTGKHPEIKVHTDEVSKLMMDSEISLIHGDYSPKNIMVMDDVAKVLDYEVACYGHPAFDLAFFSNHFILKAVKFSDYSVAYLDMLDYIVDVYFSDITFMDKKEFESHFVKTLAVLMLARVDGKSPVEYLVGDDEKQDLVRKMSLKMISEKMTLFSDVRALLRNNLEKKHVI